MVFSWAGQVVWWAMIIISGCVDPIIVGGESIEFLAPSNFSLSIYGPSKIWSLTLNAKL